MISFLLGKKTVQTCPTLCVCYLSQHEMYSSVFHITVEELWPNLLCKIEQLHIGGFSSENDLFKVMPKHAIRI